MSTTKRYLTSFFTILAKAVSISCIGIVALVRTISGMLSLDEQRHIGTVAREVANRGMALLLQPECSRRFSNDPPGHRHTHLALSWRNCDGMPDKTSAAPGVEGEPTPLGRSALNQVSTDTTVVKPID